MRLSILLCAILLVSCVAAIVNLDAPIVTPEYVEALKAEGLPWTPSVNPRFAGKSMREVMRMMRTTPRKGAPALGSKFAASPDYSFSASVPSSFDSRTQWPKCQTIKNILDQGQCGSCWSFGASESLSDRLCIATNGTTDIQLSPEALVSCDWEGNMGCNGGIPQLAWEYMELKGIPSLKCVPYTAGGGKAPPCAHTCADGSKMQLYRAKPFTQRTYDTVAHMQEAIFSDGPIEGTMSVYSDFMTYKSGVYVKSKNATYLGGHALSVIGWGQESGLDYFLVANSWGTDWGMDGFFKIATNQCGIDRDAVAGKPDV